MEKDFLASARSWCDSIMADGAGRGDQLNQNAAVAKDLAKSAAFISTQVGLVRQAVYDEPIKQEYAQGIRLNLITQLTKRQRSLQEARALLDDSEIDAVDVCLPTFLHEDAAIEALRAGKHVFVEKPMALTAEECRELCAAVEETGKQLTVGFNRRFAPFYRQLKQNLERRGSPAVVQCRIDSPGISGSYWMADPAIGGAILGEACHFIDLMYWLLDSEPVSVSAYSLPTGKADPIGENNLAASFRFADGSVGNLTYCTLGSKTSGGERVEVFAQGLGAFTEDFKRVSVHKATRSARSRIWPDKGYAAQMADFTDSIRQGRQPAVTVYDGARATLGCLAMMASARDGAPVALGPAVAL